MSFEEFSETMNILHLKLGVPWNGPRMESWYDDFKRYSSRTLRQAAWECWRKRDRFPSLSNLLDLCESAEPARKTLESEIHPVNLPAARFLLKIFEARGDHKALIQACEEASTAHPAQADLFFRMIQAAARET